MMWLFNNQYLPSICAGICAATASMVIVDFCLFASTRYRERYLQEASVELDDVLLGMPASKIFDLTLAISGLCGFLTVLLIAAFSENFTWTRGIVMGLVVALVTFPLPRIYLRHLRKQRLRKFNEQLEDALNSMSSALKAGFSINQALEGVANENKPPISFEFRLLIQEIRLGVPMEQALDNLNGRMKSSDFELVITAIVTARQTGGELTMIFERLATVIRERARIANKIQAMTAQGRMQTIIISLVPIVLLFAMSKIIPEAMNAFFSSWIGISAMVVSGLLVVCGCLAIRKIINIDI